MRDIFKNLIRNKLGSSIFIFINCIVLLCSMLAGSISREVLNQNSDVSRRNSAGKQVKITFSNKIDIKDIYSITKNLFSDDLYEFSKIGTRINDKTTFIVGINKVNDNILKLYSGRYLSDKEIKDGENKALIGKFYKDDVTVKNQKSYINIMGKEYEVVGVIGNKYGNSYYDDNVFIPVDTFPEDVKNDKYDEVIVYLNKKTDLTKLNKDEVKKNNFISGYEEIGISASPISSNIAYYKSLIIKILIMLSCVFINFHLLMSLLIKKRSTEISIKKALGFDNNRILKEFLFETLILSVISLVISFVLYKGYQSRLVNQVGASVYISPSVLCFSSLILIINSLILSRLQLRNIDNCNLCEIMQE